MRIGMAVRLGRGGPTESGYRTGGRPAPPARRVPRVVGARGASPMTALQLPDWEKVFVPDGSLLESFVRGTLVFLGILLLFRIVHKRQRGSVGLGDVMLLLLVSEAVSQALNGSFNSF